MVRNFSNQLFHLCKGRVGVNITDNDKNCVRRAVPLRIKILQGGAGRCIEGSLCAEWVVRIGRSGKHILVQAADELVRGVRKIPRHFLFDRSTFVVPLCL